MIRAEPLRPWLPLTATSAALLTWSNVIVPVLPPEPEVRAVANLAATTVLVVAARCGGVTWPELGLDRRHAGTGIRWGVAGLTLAAAGYGVALAVPTLRGMLAGAASGEPAGTVLLRIAVLVPLGTVLCEELAFRGVLLALARRVLGSGTAVAFVSVVFGLWHVRSAQVPGSAAGGLLPIIGVVVLTTIGGLLFGWLRLRGRSLLAPVGLHLGINSAGLAAATAASRLTGG